jgi:hypothetical protein
LRGIVETTEPVGPSPPPLQQKIDATVAEMRKLGVPESDVQAFLQGQATQHA